MAPQQLVIMVASFVGLGWAVLMLVALCVARAEQKMHDAMFREQMRQTKALLRAVEARQQRQAPTGPADSSS